MKFAITGIAAALAVAGTAQAATIVTVEAAGALNTTLANAVIAVETFDGQPLSNPATFPVVPVNTSFGAIGVGSTFSQTQVLAADVYGGAGGVGNQVAVRVFPALTIDFTGTPLNYFGVWASALDGGNAVSFYKAGTLISTTTLTSSPLIGAGYFGNPSGPFAGGNRREQYAFFNFRVTEGFDRVVLTQNGGGGFELDNVSIGAVPEPSTWAMLIAGFGLVGAAARRRRNTAAA